MLSSTPDISRRSLAKGAAWAAPVVLATATVPAYAASPTYEYVLGYQYQTDATYKNMYSSAPGTTNSGCTTNITVENDTVQNPDVPWSGFNITYRPGEGTDTTATLNSYQIVLTYPAGAVDNFDFTTGGDTWSVEKRDASNITVNGVNYDVSDQDIFIFTFIGPKSSEVTELGTTTASWPGSNFSASASTNYCFTSENRTFFQVGYVEYSFTTASNNQTYETTRDLSGDLTLDRG